MQTEDEQNGRKIEDAKGTMLDFVGLGFRREAGWWKCIDRITCAKMIVAICKCNKLVRQPKFQNQGNRTKIQFY